MKLSARDPLLGRRRDQDSNPFGRLGLHNDANLVGIPEQNTYSGCGGIVL